jgi:hypothetical protein
VRRPRSAYPRGRNKKKETIHDGEDIATRDAIVGAAHRPDHV